MATPGVNAPGVQPAIAAAIFQQDSFVARQKIFSLAPCFYVHDQLGNALAFLRKKVFTWKDEIRVFTDETQSLELLHIKARKIIDWGTAFDVTDSINNQKVGALKRRGWKSVIRKEWAIMDAFDQEIGRIREDSLMLAFVRRFLTALLPQTYTFELAGQQVGAATQNWNLFAPKMYVDFTADPGKRLDRRLAVAAVVLLMAVEGRQAQLD
ncbi:MAG TPA: hypothetical protein VKL99_10915 [Candidatus Angelobacter sp.]|nr:hypothetical protein [Candidatus Angelobacter sp.]